MSARVFAARSFTNIKSTPVVSVGEPMFLIEGTYRHPVTGKDTPLPPHQFVLADANLTGLLGLTGIFGSDSKLTGKSSIMRDPANMGPGPFFVAFHPSDLETYKYWLEHHEAWVDLDTGTWAASQPKRGKLERRNLYRIPIWTTIRKANLGGGFKEWVPDASPESRKSGRLAPSELPQSGTFTWHIPIDHGWPLVTVRHFYFDWGRDKQNTLPPGLFVDAVMPNGARVGSGVAVRNADGAARMMIESGAGETKPEETPFAPVEFQFRAPKPAAPIGPFLPGEALLRVDLAAPEPAAGAKDMRLVDDAPMPTDRHVVNALPDEWHSLGHRCTVTARSFCYEKDTWLTRRASLKRDVDDLTVEFHLDDVFLGETATDEESNLNGVPTLFDHYMRLLHPKTTRPHLSDCKATHSLIDAEKAYTIGEELPAVRKRLDRSTRLIHFDGGLYDLRGDRRTGTLGRTFAVGARTALRNKHAQDTCNTRLGNSPMAGLGNFQIHHIDVPGVLDPASGKNLGHVLLFVPFILDRTGSSPEVVKVFYERSLPKGTRVWSQGSPGIDGQTKDYRIVPKALTARDRVLRFRVYLGEVRGDEMLSIHLDRSTAPTSAVAIRSVYPVPMRLRETGVWGDEYEIPDASKRSDSDGALFSGCEFAHEMGHVFGLPDDYGEGTGTPTALEYLSTKNQVLAEGWRPFYGDRHAIMNDNMALPRLRYYWHFLEALNTNSRFAKLRGGDTFVLRNETLASGIEYVRITNEHRAPYSTVFDEQAIPGGFGKCALFPVGNDEGTVEGMFARPGELSPQPMAATDRVGALLLVRAKLRFRFSNLTPADPAREMVRDRVVKELYNDEKQAKVRFVLEGPAPLKRVAIVLQPNFAFDGKNSSEDDLVFEVANTPALLPDPFASGRVGPEVHLNETQLNANCVLRAILGIPTKVSGASPAIPNVSPLGAADFVNLKKILDTKLGGAWKVVPM